MSSTFISAEEARKGARNNLLIHQEINGIEEAILKAVDEYKYDVKVTSGTPMTTVSKILSVEVTDAGSGYSTANAIVTVDHPTGTNANIVAEVQNGVIVSYNILNGGTGYDPVSATIDMTASGDGNAILQPVVNNGVITQINILSGGSNYQVSDTIVFVHPTGINASAEITAVNPGGTIQSVNLISGGQDYGTINPELVVTHPTGHGATALISTNNGVINSVTVLNGGVGYTQIKPTAVAVDTTGVGAELTVNMDADTIGSIDVVAGGSNYTTSTTIEISDIQNSSGSGATAIATVQQSENPVDTTKYYNVYRKTESDRAVSEQFNTIVTYFEDLGYNIQLIENPDSPYTIAWYILW